MSDSTKGILIGFNVMIANAFLMGYLAPPIWANILWSMFVGAIAFIMLEKKYHIVDSFLDK